MGLYGNAGNVLKDAVTVMKQPILFYIGGSSLFQNCIQNMKQFSIINWPSSMASLVKSFVGSQVLETVARAGR